MKLVKNLIGKGPKKTEVSEEETTKRYEKIQQYVKKKQVGKDGMVTVEFACSEAKQNFVTTVPLRDPNVGGSITDCVDDKTKKKMTKQTETSLKKNMVKTISGCFPPTMRRNANKALDTGLRSVFAALDKKISTTSPDEKDKLEKLAVIRAWETEGRRNFVFDPQTKKFVAESVRPDWMSDFKRHLKDHPMQEANETDVLQRVLVDLACVDGEISPEEKEFLETFLTESIGSLQKRPVTDKDFSDIPDMKVKESLVMIAYALAWCDDTVDQAEETLLGKYEAFSQVPTDRLGTLRDMVKMDLMETIVDGLVQEGELDDKARDEIEKHRVRLGLGKEQVDTIEHRIKSKRGVFF